VDVLDYFENYKWNGNVRELENVVERAVTLAKGKKITIAELPTYLFTETAAAISFDKVKFTDAKQIAVEEVEKKYLLHLLQKHKGNITKMAEDAGMTRRNIHRMLNNHNINTNDWRS
jgi:DNA-binding NtrC family response regulator